MARANSETKSGKQARQGAQKKQVSSEEAGRGDASDQLHPRPSGAAPSSSSGDTPSAVKNGGSTAAASDTRRAAELNSAAEGTGAVGAEAVKLGAGVATIVAADRPSLQKLLEAQNCPTLWGLQGAVDADIWSDLLRVTAPPRHRRRRQSAGWTGDVVEWLIDWQRGPWNVSGAALLIVLARHLPVVLEQLDTGTASQLLDFLADTARESRLETHEDGANLVHQWLTVELPLLLAHWAHAGSAAPELLGLGISRWNTMVRESMDGEGQLAARDWPWLRPLWTSLTFSLALIEGNRSLRKASAQKVAKDARTQYSWLVRQALRMTRADGRSAGGVDSGSWQELLALAQASLRIAPDRDDTRIVEAWSAKKGPKGKQLPPPGDHSEWAETALFRGGWQRKSLLCALRYDRRTWNVELANDRQIWWRGNWMPQITVDGRVTAPAGDWESTCWESDEDVDYLELEMELERGWRLQRQCCWARSDQLLLIADAVLGSQPGEIQYRSQLPLAPGVRLWADDAATELRMGTQEPEATLFPLALPEWKQLARQGSFAAATATWQQTARGRALYAPLVVDLDRRRQDKEVTWRALTVAQDLEIVSADDAVAYRLQIGKRHWVLYRSLTALGNRTFIGQNLATEFLWARFLRSGETETLIEIE